MLTSNPITKLVFVDIETKAKYDNFTDLPQKMKNLFMEKHQYLIGEHAHALSVSGTDTTEAFKLAYDGIYKEKAHLSPEFAEVLCISAGMIMEDYTFKCVSFCGGTEKEILTAFMSNPKSFLHQKDSASADTFVVCYNALGFDIPFLGKRIMYNGLELPARFELAGLKPWNIYSFVDIKEQLKFGGMDAPSLEMLCTQLGIKTAQDLYGEPNFAGKDPNYIKTYAEQDVFALAQAYLKLIRSKEHPNGVQNNLTKI